jgi:hypothetical protein
LSFGHFCLETGVLPSAVHILVNLTPVLLT